MHRPLPIATLDHLMRAGKMGGVARRARGVCCRGSSSGSGSGGVCMCVVVVYVCACVCWEGTRRGEAWLLADRPTAKPVRVPTPIAVCVRQLAHLDLSGNGLSTTALPGAALFHSLTALQTLDLGSSELTEVPDFSRQTQLQELYVLLTTPLLGNGGKINFVYLTAAMPGRCSERQHWGLGYYEK